MSSAGLAAALALAAASLPALGRECAAPEYPTEFHAPKRLRQALEAFRRSAESGRALAEARRAAGELERVRYRAAIARYREDIGFYFAGVVHARNLPCPHLANEILALGVHPGRLDPRYDLGRGNDVIELRIAYWYTGDRGDAVSIGAITLAGGESTGHWAYRPHRLHRGLDVATVRLAMTADGPERYRSDAISAEMYIHGRNVFAQRVFPYAREWRRRTSD